MSTNTIQLTDEQYAALQKGESITIEPPKKKPEVHPLLWVPKIGEDYCYLSADRIGKDVFNSDNFDNRVIECQQIFKTEAEASKAHEQRIALMQVNRQVVRLTQEQFPEWVCDWSKNPGKWCPYFDHGSQTVVLVCTTYVQAQFTFEHAPKQVWEQIDKNLIKLAMGI